MAATFGPTLLSFQVMVSFLTDAALPLLRLGHRTWGLGFILRVFHPAFIRLFSHFILLAFAMR
jgi:hypothetical protein